MSQPTRVIGRTLGVQGVIPWHLPEDFQRFRKLTFNHPVIMGRKTFESLAENVRPLPGRLNIVMTSNENTYERIQQEYIQYDSNTNTGLIVATHLTHAVMVADIEGKTHWNADQIFIIGGASVYNEALDQDIVDKMYLTYIDQPIDGDICFPELKKEHWIPQLTGGPANHAGLDYTFFDYLRRSKNE
jgi:dihydrofolate reductase